MIFDYEFSNQWARGFEKRSHGGYARRKSKGKTVYLHQLVARRIGLSLDCGEIDHCDGDGLNNCRANLRLATCSQNSANQQKSRRNTTGFKGVYPH